MDEQNGENPEKQIPKEQEPEIEEESVEEMMGDEPQCENCESPASECECYDDEAIHEIIAYRIANGHFESEWLQPKSDEDEEEVAEEETPPKQ